MTSRLFLALWPDDTLRGELAAWRDGWCWPGKATPVRTERMHITLHFLGDIDDDRIGALADAVDVPFAPFALTLGRNALWPHGIAVLEPETVPAPLLALHGALGQTLESFGVALDARAYRPHVTLARRAERGIAERDGPRIEWHVNGYALMQSEGGYRVLRDYPG